VWAPKAGSRATLPLKPGCVILDPQAPKVLLLPWASKFCFVKPE